MIGIGFGVRTSQGASSARQSRPASNNSTRLAGSSESRAATAAPAEPPPTTMTSYMALLLDVPENRNCRRYQTAQISAIGGRLSELPPRNGRSLIVHHSLDLGSDLLAILLSRCLGKGIQQRSDALVALPAREVDAVERHHDVGKRRRQIEAAGLNAINAPAFLLGTTCKHRGPIHHVQIDIEAGLLQLLCKNLRRNARRLEVAGLHHNDRLAGIFRRLECRARRLDGRIRCSFGSGLAVIGGAA